MDGETPAEFLARMRSIGVISKRTKSNTIMSEGRTHPETGLSYKIVRDEAGNDTTVHSRPLTGVDSRQDVNINAKIVQRSAQITGEK